MHPWQSGGRRRDAEPVFIAVLTEHASQSVAATAFSGQFPDGWLTLAGQASSVSELWSLVSHNPVRVVVAEHSFRQVAALPWEKRPRLLALVDEATEAQAAGELASHCDFVVVQPVGAGVLRQRVLQLAAFDLDEHGRLHPNVNDGLSNAQKALASRISRLLETLGVPRELKGSAYLSDGIWLAALDPSYLRNLTNRLYPFLAQRHGTTVARVERNIRHAIDAAWIRGNLSLLYGLFGPTVSKEKGKPTNAAFLARVAEEVRTHAEKRETP